MRYIRNNKTFEMKVGKTYIDVSNTMERIDVVNNYNVFSAGTPGRRYALPNARFLMQKQGLMEFPVRGQAR